MRNKWFLILGMLLSLGLVWGQGSEDFSKASLTTAYLDGSFVGNGEITWYYGHSRDESSYAIDGKGIMLRRASDSYLQATIPGGIGNFSFKYRKAEIGSNQRILTLLINDVQKWESSVFGNTSGAETTVYLSSNTINESGNVNVRIKLKGEASQNAHCVLDDISWTAYAGSPALADPIARDATDIGGTSFTANWNAVTGATGYRLDVYQKTTGGDATDLILSEYIKGSSNNKYVEIFNGTGSSVDLSDYKLVQYNNGSSSITYTLNLSGELAKNSVYVIANHQHSVYSGTVNLSTNSNVMTFTGDDALALMKGDQHVDIFGRIGDDPGTAWTADGGYSTENKTLVRKSSVSSGITVSPTGTGAGAFTTLATEWDVYPQDTTTYLGSHTFTGAASNTYVTGFENKNVSNVTSYVVTGLEAGKTYYYVVRAYDNYGQTSSSSNEIQVTTVLYDIPENEETEIGEDITITIENGAANIVLDGTIPEWPNADFTPTFSIVLELFGAGPYDMMIETTAPWGAYYLNGSWHKEENEGGGFLFIDIEASKGLMFPIILGDQDPTLPVELSAFTVAFNSRNQAVLTWVSETETGMIGYYIYRNSTEALDSALQISELIPATSTSQQQIYIFTDKELDGAGTYYYWLQTNDMDGTIGYYGPIYLLMENDLNDSQTAPLLTRLGSIYPNPFNPDTTISYSLAGAEEIELRIYNTRGQLVRTLEKGSRNAGNYRLIWDAKDDNDRTVSSGIYFIRLNAGNKSFMKKAILLK